MKSRSEKLCVTVDTVLLLTITDDSMAIATTTGLFAVECSWPHWIFRDHAAGQVLDFRARVSGTDAKFSYGVRSVRLLQRPRPALGLRPLPDNVSVRDGWFILETNRRTDYHPWVSLQVVGINRASQLLIGFSTVSYLITIPNPADVQRQFEEIIDGRCRCHCTFHPAAAFFEWLPNHRIHCERIDELPELPDSLDGFLAVEDFSGRPEHAAFKKKAATIARPGGPSIDL